MKKLTKKQEEEFFFYTEREMKRLEEVFSCVKLKSKKRKHREIFEMAKSYFQDALYFESKKEHTKVFELLNYIWGLLDALAIENVLEIPKKIRTWFKIKIQ